MLPLQQTRDPLAGHQLLQLPLRTRRLQNVVHYRLLQGRYARLALDVRKWRHPRHAPEGNFQDGIEAHLHRRKVVFYRVHHEFGGLGAQFRLRYAIPGRIDSIVFTLLILSKGMCQISRFRLFWANLGLSMFWPLVCMSVCSQILVNTISQEPYERQTSNLLFGTSLKCWKTKNT